MAHKDDKIRIKCKEQQYKYMIMKDWKNRRFSLKTKAREPNLWIDTLLTAYIRQDKLSNFIDPASMARAGAYYAPMIPIVLSDGVCVPTASVAITENVPIKHGFRCVSDLRNFVLIKFKSAFK